MKAKIIFVAITVLMLLLSACGALANCDPGYQGVCIAPPPPDLNCDDIQFRNFKVVGRDSHGFDADNDGIACEG